MTMQNQNTSLLDTVCGSNIRVSILDRLASVDLCTFDSPEYAVFPGFCDVHVHFREPGFSYKESIFSGSLAAAHGGYTAVCTMPNLDPVPDTKAHLKEQLDLIKQDGYTLVPLSVYFKDARVKVEVGLCKGKKNYDKREAAAKRDAKREIDRTLKERNR